MEAPHESSSWKETPEEIVRYPSCVGEEKQNKSKKKKKNPADLNNNAMWMKSDLL